MLVTIMPKHLQPSRRLAQHQLQGALPHFVTRSASAALPSIQRRAAAAGWVPLPGMAQQPDVALRAAATIPAAVPPGTASELQPVALQQEQGGSTDALDAAHAKLTSLSRAASLPLSLPGSPSEPASHDGAFMVSQQSFDTAASRPWTATATQAVQSPVAAATAAAGRPSDVLHAIACTAMPCSPPAASDERALPPPAAAQHAGVCGLSSAAAASSWACQVCGQTGMSEDAAWQHFKVTSSV